MNLCYVIADGIHRYRARRAPVTGDRRRKDDGAYWTLQQQSSRQYFEKFFDLERRLRDASVIDIGCGLGGRTCYLAAQGVRQIVGTYINHAEIDRARQLATQLGDFIIREKVSFQKVTENREAKDNGDRLVPDGDVQAFADAVIQHIQTSQSGRRAFVPTDPAGMADQMDAVIERAITGGQATKKTTALPLGPKSQNGPMHSIPDFHQAFHEAPR